VIPNQGALSRALHTELELEYSSRDSSRNEFSRVEMRRVECHFFVIFGNLSKRLVPTLIFANFSRKLGSEQVGTSRNKSERVRKARNISKIFRNSKNGNFRNSRKRKFWKKRLTHGLSLEEVPWVLQRTVKQSFN